MTPTYATFIGNEAGTYEIVDAVGAGGMSEVCRARDSRLDRTVAIKVLAFAAFVGPRSEAAIRARGTNHLEVLSPEYLHLT